MAIYLFDWGNTLMVDLEGQSGPMCEWPLVSVVEGAYSVLHFLSRRGPVYIATNAADSKQEDVRKAFVRVGLDKYISGYFCKDSLGISKDSPDYYRTIAGLLNSDVTELTMVGDTFDKDIVPALEAGLDTVWLSASFSEFEFRSRFRQIETLFSLITQDFPSIENQQIKLEPPTMERNEQILEAVTESYSQLAEFLPWVHSALTIDDTNQNIHLAHYNFMRGESELRFSIIDRDTDQLLGMIGLLLTDLDVPRFEIGYWLRTDQTGKGIVSQAVQLLESFAITQLGAKRIDIRAVGKNLRSQKVAERNGYQLEARYRLARRNPDGELDDELLFTKLIEP